MKRPVALAIVLTLAGCNDGQPPTAPELRPSYSDLDGYTDEEILEQYQSGQLAMTFPTRVSNARVKPGIGPQSYWSTTSYDYLASVRTGWSEAAVFDGNYFVQGSRRFDRKEGSDLFLNVEDGHFSITTGDIWLAELPCGLRTRGTGGYLVYNAVAIAVKQKLVGLSWGEKGYDDLMDYGIVFSHRECEPEPPPPPSSGGSGDQCWYCEYWVWEDETGDIVDEEEVCWEIDWSICEGTVT